MISSPLEQFELIPLIPIRFGDFDISITHSTLFMLIAVGISVYFLTKEMDIELGDIWGRVSESDYGQIFFFEGIIVCANNPPPLRTNPSKSSNFTVLLAIVQFPIRSDIA